MAEKAATQRMTYGSRPRLPRVKEGFVQVETTNGEMVRVPLPKKVVKETNHRLQRLEA
jgi:hypothetical protein